MPYLTFKATFILKELLNNDQELIKLFTGSVMFTVDQGQRFAFMNAFINIDKADFFAV